MSATIVVPNTRQEGWKETLKLQAENCSQVFLVEPDAPVYEYLKEEGIDFILIDPQHLGEGEYSSAIKMAEAFRSNIMSGSLFVLGFKLDLDSVGATAVLLSDQPIKPERIEVIDTIDNGHWAPSEWNPSSMFEDLILLSSEEIPATKIMGAALADRNPAIGPGAKVQFMLDWLQNDVLPEGYEEKVREERAKLLGAKISWPSGIKMVECEAAGVSSLIYHNTEMAGKGVPFGIAFNPNFRGQGPKYSVMQWSNEYIDTQKLWDVLNKIEGAEGTWGGNLKLGIGGSPLGSTLTPSQVAKAVSQCLTEKGETHLMLGA